MSATRARAWLRRDAHAPSSRGLRASCWSRRQTWRSPHPRSTPSVSPLSPVAEAEALCPPGAEVEVEVAAAASHRDHAPCACKYNWHECQVPKTDAGISETAEGGRTRPRRASYPFPCLVHGLYPSSSPSSPSSSLCGRDAGCEKRQVPIRHPMDNTIWRPTFGAAPILSTTGADNCAMIGRCRHVRAPQSRSTQGATVPMIVRAGRGCHSDTQKKPIVGPSAVRWKNLLVVRAGVGIVTAAHCVRGYSPRMEDSHESTDEWDTFEAS
jgi:hypothetical protein